MIGAFGDEGTEDVFDGRSTRKARKSCLQNLWRVARRKLDQTNQARNLEDLRVSPGNRLEPLKRGREGQHSIRINEQYRVCFEWVEDGAEEVEIVDYH